MPTTMPRRTKRATEAVRRRVKAALRRLPGKSAVAEDGAHREVGDGATASAASADTESAVRATRARRSGGALNVPNVSTPLHVIALFVALIELFLSYPVTRLTGPERLIVVIFMTAFPFFV